MVLFLLLFFFFTSVAAIQDESAIVRAGEAELLQLST